MTQDGPSTDAISLAAWPSPVCYVEAADVSGSDAAVVRAANAPFESIFGSDSTDDSIEHTLTAVGIDAETLPDVNEFVASDEHRPVRISTRSVHDASADSYLLQSVPGDSTTGGYLVFTPLPPEASIELPSRGIELETVASAISHDLRNPLDVATTRLRAARETDDERAADEHLEHVSRAHDRMERLIEDVLTLAGTADAVDPDDAVDLRAVAEAAWATVDTEDAQLAVTAESPTIIADQARLRRLFENLFRNSVEHAPEQTGSARADDVAGDGSQGPTIAVGRLEDGTDDGFYVVDDGKGIPRDRMESVFEPGVSSDDHGTGLGLAIVERIVVRHGWSIAVTAAADGGAKFEITDVTFATNH